MQLHKVQWRTFWGLVGGFILVIPAATLLHEAAHYFTAKLFGYEGYISYRSTVYTHINDGGNSFSWNRILVKLAGPLQTMFTGLLGLALLYYHRQSIQRSRQLNFRQWTMVFLSLFWLRQVFILIVIVLLTILNEPYPAQSDEMSIGLFLHWPAWLIPVITGLIGLLIGRYVFRKFIPEKQKGVFLLAAITGCFAGYFLWFEWLGKILLPVR